MSIFENILASFNNTPSGFSARKLSAFVLMVCVVWLHYKYVDTNVVVEVIVTDLCFVLLLLGIITVQNIIELRKK